MTDRFSSWWHHLWYMGQDEYDVLNPPSRQVNDKQLNIYEQIIESGDWQHMGHIPARKTRFGEFVFNIVHGLLMRYRLLPVLWWSWRAVYASHLLPSGYQLFREDGTEIEFPDEFVYVEDEKELCERFSKEEIAGFVTALESQHRQALIDVKELVNAKLLNATRDGDDSAVKHLSELYSEIDGHFYVGTRAIDVDSLADVVRERCM